MAVGIRGCYGKRTRDSRCFEFDGCVFRPFDQAPSCSINPSPISTVPRLFHQLPACRNSFPLPTPAALTS